MSKKDKYILDSSVFIEAHRRYYAFDIAPNFWKSIKKEMTNGNIISIDKVKDELIKGGDELTDWINNNFASAFLKTDDIKTITQFGEIMIAVQAESQYTEGAKLEFASVADGWLIASAKVNNFILVTQEVLNLDKKSKIPIPNICRLYNVQYMDTFQMLRYLRIQL